MEYRISVPDDYDCEDEDEEFDHLHGYVQGLMHNTGRFDIVDTLLMMANICEVRALLNAHFPVTAEWYTKTGQRIRHTLDTISSDSTVALPNKKLENPLLYYDMDTEKTH